MSSAILGEDVVDLELRTLIPYFKGVAKTLHTSDFELLRLLGVKLGVNRSGESVHLARENTWRDQRGSSVEETSDVNQRTHLLREKVLDALSRLEQMDVEG